MRDERRNETAPYLKAAPALQFPVLEPARRARSQVVIRSVHLEEAFRLVVPVAAAAGCGAVTCAAHLLRQKQTITLQI